MAGIRLQEGVQVGWGVSQSREVLWPRQHACPNAVRLSNPSSRGVGWIYRRTLSGAISFLPQELSFSEGPLRRIIRSRYGKAL